MDESYINLHGWNKKWLRMEVEWDYSYYRNIFEGELAIFRKDVA